MSLSTCDLAACRRGWRRQAAALMPLHQADEALKQIMAVLRAGRGFRVILHGKDRAILHAETFVAAVEQRDVRDLDIGRQRFRDDDEAVVLAGDLDLAGGEVLDRMISTAMAALHLLGAAA